MEGGESMGPPVSAARGDEGADASGRDGVVEAHHHRSGGFRVVGARGGGVAVSLDVLNGGDMADAIAGLIEESGAAAARSPVGADGEGGGVGAGGEEVFFGGGVFRSGAADAVDNAGGEDGAVSLRVAEAEDGVADLDVGLERERLEVVAAEADERGVVGGVGGEDGCDGEEFVLSPEDDGEAGVGFGVFGVFEDMPCGGDGLGVDGVAAGEGLVPAGAAGALVNPADAHVGKAGPFGDLARTEERLVGLDPRDGSWTGLFEGGEERVRGKGFA